MKKVALSIFCFAIFSFSLQAEEGMFMLTELPMNTLTEAGLELSEQEIYSSDTPSISDAIVQIGGGTGSFVSEDGLVITNHHVAVSALQTVSSEQNNYLENGYEATSTEEEIYVEGYTAYLAVKITDVSKKIHKQVNSGMSPKERQEAIQKTINALENEKESSADPIYHYDVSEFYSGLEYYLIEYLEFQDIRLVYAPEKSIGNYGGDVDNWMWPRHTGDFAFFRLYINPEGTESKYAQTNIPFQPDSYLKFSNEGVKDGDFNFIIGYPGSTQRHRTSFSVQHAVEKSYPFNIQVYTDVIDIINGEIQANENLQIIYSSRLASLNNYQKNYRGMLEGLKRAHLITLKKATEKDLNAWIEDKTSRKSSYGHVIQDIKQVYSKIDSSFEQESIMKYMEWLVNTYYAATLLEEWSLEKEKPNLERKSKYMERNIPSLKEELKILQKRFHPEVDAEIMKHFLYKLAKLPESLQIEPVMQMLGHPDIDNLRPAIAQFVDSLYNHTRLIYAEDRLDIFEMSRKEMQDLGDPMLDFAFKLHEVRRKLDGYSKYIHGQITKLRPQFIQALMEWQDTDFYPDANFTPRLTSGVVKGYSPKDAVIYDYITSIEGIVEKHTGKTPFDTPDLILKQIQNKNLPEKYFDDYIENVPVNFLHTTDITGGNSGSPVMDRKGNFIGIAFDGNWESISADWVFNPLLTRSISVDARYILYILENIAQTHYVFDELNVVN